jgi:hypothetical protein
MDFLSSIKILKKYGIENIDNKILERIQNNKKSYIQLFIEFNIYQILSFFIYNQLNITHKFITLKSGNLLVNTNKTGPIIQSNIVIHPLIKNKHKEFLNCYTSKSKETTITLKNLNSSANYLFFLPINANINENDNEIIKCMNYYFIFIENKNSTSIIVKEIYNKIMNDCCLIEFQKFDDATLSVTNEIFNSPFRISKHNYLVAKLIATWQRETIITDILNQEEKIQTDYNYCNIIGYSILNEINYIIKNTHKKDNLLYFYTPNMPLGLKWRHIAEFNKILNTEYLLIQGSDDKILLNKINRQMISKYDFIGQHDWYIYNSLQNDLYKFRLKYNVLRGGLYVIGAGRLIKKEQVARFNYNIFNPYRIKGLDYQMNCLATGISNRLICEPICYSIKGGHKCFHQIERYLKSKNLNYEKMPKDTIL